VSDRAIGCVCDLARAHGTAFSPAQRLACHAATGAHRLSDADNALWRLLFAVDPLPHGTRAKQVTLIVGRQAGKSLFAAYATVFTALHPSAVVGMRPGESRHAILIAPTVRQASRLLKYVRDILRNVAPKMIAASRKDEIELRNGVTVAVWTARHAALRGLQIVSLVVDEAAHHFEVGPRAITDLISAARPAMAHVRNPVLLLITSPWAKAGAVFEAWRGRQSTAPALLCMQASSATFWPAFPKDVLEAEAKRDPENYRREYCAEFLDTIGCLFDSELLEACVVAGRKFLPSLKGVRYVGAIDAATVTDSFVVGIAHAHDGRLIVDQLHGWTPGAGKPLRLDKLIPDLADRLTAYHVQAVVGDQYSAAAMSELLSRHGIHYRQAAFTVQSKMDFYGALRERVNNSTIELLDHEPSLRELRQIERRALQGGAWRIEAPRGAGHHDDYADVLALLAFELRTSRHNRRAVFGQDSDYTPPGGRDLWLPLVPGQRMLREL